jgi:hypothetical protein
VVAQCVADDPPAADVENVGQVEPAFARGDIGDVAAGPLPGFARGEIARDQVRERRSADVGDGRADLRASVVCGVDRETHRV